MKPTDTLDNLLERAHQHQIFGTKMRSAIEDANRNAVLEVVDNQQFAYGARICAAGLVPILEPKSASTARTKAKRKPSCAGRAASAPRGAAHGHDHHAEVDDPNQPGQYADLAADRRVLRVLALSGGYDRDKACRLLARDPSLIASFLRALRADLRCLGEQGGSGLRLPNRQRPRPSGTGVPARRLLRSW